MTRKDAACLLYNAGRCCYVTVRNAASHIYQAYRNGRTPFLRPEHYHLFQGKQLRISAYGDPIAVPCPSPAIAPHGGPAVESCYRKKHG